MILFGLWGFRGSDLNLNLNLNGAMYGIYTWMHGFIPGLVAARLAKAEQRLHESSIYRTLMRATSKSGRGYIRQGIGRGIGIGFGIEMKITRGRGLRLR